MPADVALSISTGLLGSNKDVRSWSNDTDGPIVNKNRFICYFFNDYTVLIE